MQTSLNGTLVLNNGQTALISRESDFGDLLRYSTQATLFRAVEALKEVCASFGEARSAIMDLYRQRLAQLRQHLRMA